MNTLNLLDSLADRLAAERPDGINDPQCKAVIDAGTMLTLVFAKLDGGLWGPDLCQELAGVLAEYGLAPARGVPRFKVGDRVKKVTGEYHIAGEVRSVFQKVDASVRLVVEHTAEGGGSFLHIYGENNLELEG